MAPGGGALARLTNGLIGLLGNGHLGIEEGKQLCPTVYIEFPVNALRMSLTVGIEMNNSVAMSEAVFFCASS